MIDRLCEKGGREGGWGGREGDETVGGLGLGGMVHVIQYSSCWSTYSISENFIIVVNRIHCESSEFASLCCDW